MAPLVAEDTLAFDELVEVLEAKGLLFVVGAEAMKAKVSSGCTVNESNSLAVFDAGFRPCKSGDCCFLESDDDVTETV